MHGCLLPLAERTAHALAAAGGFLKQLYGRRLTGGCRGYPRLVDLTPEESNKRYFEGTGVLVQRGGMGWGRVAEPECQRAAECPRHWSACACTRLIGA